MKNTLKEKLEGLKKQKSDYSSIRLKVIEDIQDYEDDESIKDHFKYLLEYGLAGGVVGDLMYYSDINLFFDQCYHEIEAIRIGHFHRTGKSLKVETSCDLRTFFTWFAYEYVVDEILEELELDLDQ